MPRTNRAGVSGSARGKHAVADGMRNSSKLPTQDRSTYYPAPGLQATREAAGLTQEQLAERAGYALAVVSALENGGTAHTVTISRLAAACGVHDLRVVRGEGPGGVQVTRFADIDTRERGNE